MTSRTRSVALLVSALALALPLGSAATAQAADPVIPSLQVSVVQQDLQHPWDIAFLPPVADQVPPGSMLYTERARKRLTLRLPDGTKRAILNGPSGMWSSGETGLMAVEADNRFATTREFVTCQGYRSRTGATSVQVVRWRMNTTFSSASQVRVLVSGLPATTGRHGGCALVLSGDGRTLFVGTGDAAVGRNPQNRASGGGKILRVDAVTGAPSAGNPWISSSNRLTRQLYTTGHRNVQGLARRLGGSIYSAEQGSYRDDEVNRVRSGGNYGWNPVPRRSGDPSYNEGSNSPMTDFAVPGAQVRASWSSGTSTIATSGIAFVKGSAWGRLDGLLAIGVLKGQRILMLRLDPDGTLLGTYTPPELRGTYGRLRSAVMGPDGALYVTTANGSNDKILRVTPVAAG